MKPARPFLLALVALSDSSFSADLPLRFSFGSSKQSPDSRAVPADAIYSTEKGFGFEPGAAVTGAESFSSDRPFYFSVALPEGNYRVTFTPGGSPTSVKRSCGG